MKEWVLLLILNMSGDGGVRTTQIEFNTLEACQAASVTIQKDIKARRHDDGYQSPKVSSVTCLHR